jgi:antirestriction protein ArdC
VGMSIIKCLDSPLFDRTLYSMKHTKKMGRPKKAPAAVKNSWLEVRCEESEREAFRAAAEAQGIAMSAWIRQALRRAARKELEDLSLPVAFLDRLSA